MTCDTEVAIEYIKITSVNAGEVSKFFSVAVELRRTEAPKPITQSTSANPYQPLAPDACPAFIEQEQEITTPKRHEPKVCADDAKTFPNASNTTSHFPVTQPSRLN